MREAGRDSTADRGRRVEESDGVSGRAHTRRRWSAEDKTRVVRESFRPGKLVGQVAHRYGVSRWQLSAWRSLVRAGKLAVPGLGQPEPVDVAPEAAPAGSVRNSVFGPPRPPSSNLESDPRLRVARGRRPSSATSLADTALIHGRCRALALLDTPRPRALRASGQAQLVCVKMNHRILIGAPFRHRLEADQRSMSSNQSPLAPCSLAHQLPRPLRLHASP